MDLVVDQTLWAAIKRFYNRKRPFGQEACAPRRPGRGKRRRGVWLRRARRGSECFPLFFFSVARKRFGTGGVCCPSACNVRVIVAWLAQFCEVFVTKTGQPRLGDFAVSVVMKS